MSTDKHDQTLKGAKGGLRCHKRHIFVNVRVKKKVMQKSGPAVECFVDCKLGRPLQGTNTAVGPQIMKT